MDKVDNVGRFLNDNKMIWKRRFPVDPERLWETIATKDGLSHWFMPTAFEIEDGGRFSFEGGWEGTVSETGPSHHIQFDVDGDSGGYLRFEIEAIDGGSSFSLIDRMDDEIDMKRWPEEPAHRTYQPGGPGKHWSGVAAGYHGFLDSLEDYITGGKVSSDYDEMCKEYMKVLDEHFRR